MTLLKAIEILFDLAREPVARDHPDYIDAIKLSVQALYLINSLRGHPQYLHTGLLEGETKE